MPKHKIKKLSMAELNRLTSEEFMESSKQPICIVLDNIRSLQNVGSFFRTADAFRIEKIVLCGITGQPPHRDIEKTALGATESVNFQYFNDVMSAISCLKKEGWKITCLEQTNNRVLLQNFSPQMDSKYAYVFGNEVFGVDLEVLKAADIILEIPQFGTKHSFNVSVSCGIVLWDYYLKTSLKRSSNPL